MWRHQPYEAASIHCSRPSGYASLFSSNAPAAQSESGNQKRRVIVSAPQRRGANDRRTASVSTTPVGLQGWTHEDYALALQETMAQQWLHSESYAEDTDATPTLDARAVCGASLSRRYQRRLRAFAQPPFPFCCGYGAAAAGVPLPLELCCDRHRNVLLSLMCVKAMYPSPGSGPYQHSSRPAPRRDRRSPAPHCPHCSACGRWAAHSSVRGAAELQCCGTPPVQTFPLDSLQPPPVAHDALALTPSHRTPSQDDSSAAPNRKGAEDAPQEEGVTINAFNVNYYATVCCYMCGSSAHTHRTCPALLTDSKDWLINNPAFHYTYGREAPQGECIADDDALPLIVFCEMDAKVRMVQPPPIFTKPLGHVEEMAEGVFIYADVMAALEEALQLEAERLELWWNGQCIYRGGDAPASPPASPGTSLSFCGGLPARHVWLLGAPLQPHSERSAPDIPLARDRLATLPQSTGAAALHFMLLPGDIAYLRKRSSPSPRRDGPIAQPPTEPVPAPAPAPHPTASPVNEGGQQVASQQHPRTSASIVSPPLDSAPPLPLPPPPPPLPPAPAAIAAPSPVAQPYPTPFMPFHFHHLPPWQRDASAAAAKARIDTEKTSPAISEPRSTSPGVTPAASETRTASHPTPSQGSAAQLSAEAEAEAVPRTRNSTEPNPKAEPPCDGRPLTWAQQLLLKPKNQAPQLPPVFLKVEAREPAASTPARSDHTCGTRSPAGVTPPTPTPPRRSAEAEQEQEQERSPSRYGRRIESERFSKAKKEPAPECRSLAHLSREQLLEGHFPLALLPSPSEPPMKERASGHLSRVAPLNTIYIRFLPPKLTHRELRDLLEAKKGAGEVSKVRVVAGYTTSTAVQHHPCSSRGSYKLAFVEYASPEAAAEAREHLRKKVVGRNTLVVQLARHPIEGAYLSDASPSKPCTFGLPEEELVALYNAGCYTAYQCDLFDQQWATTTPAKEEGEEGARTWTRGSPARRDKDSGRERCRRRHS